MAWVGTYDDLMLQNDGEYCFTIAEDFANSAKSGDTGYAGVVVLDDGTFIMDSMVIGMKIFHHSGMEESQLIFVILN